jgi:hypothetical protein
VFGCKSHGCSAKKDNGWCRSNLGGEQILLTEVLKQEVTKIIHAIVIDHLYRDPEYPWTLTLGHKSNQKNRRLNPENT